MAIQKLRRKIERFISATQAALQTPYTLIPGQIGFAVDTNSFVIRDLDENSYTTYVIGGSGGLSPVSPTVGYITKFASGSTVDDSSLQETVSEIVSTKPVQLPGDPTNPLEAATKQYVDNLIETGNFDVDFQDQAANVIAATVPVYYHKIGKLVTLKFPAVTGTIIFSSSFLRIVNIPGPLIPDNNTNASQGGSIFDVSAPSTIRSFIRSANNDLLIHSIAGGTFTAGAFDIYGITTYTYLLP